MQVCDSHTAGCSEYYDDSYVVHRHCVLLEHTDGDRQLNRHCLMTPYFIEINTIYWYRKTNYRTPLLSAMTHTMCSSVSVVNALLQWYLQFFSVFQLLLGLCSLQLGCRLTTADTYSHASDGAYGTTLYVTRSVLEPTPTTRHHTVYYNTCWCQFSATVCPTLSVNCAFEYRLRQK